MRAVSHSIHIFVVCLLTLELQHAHAQDKSGDCIRMNGTTAQQAKCSIHSEVNISLTLAGDGGKDRYGILVIERSKWKLVNINWVSPDGGDAVSLVMAGRKFAIAKHVESEVLVGPWYEYLNRAWDEAVVDTNLHIQQRRLRCTFINHWGFPLKASGDFFDSHIQSINGFPRVPKWIAASLNEKQTEGHLDRFDVGVGLIRPGRISLTAIPYWDFRRKTADLRIAMSIHRVLQ